MRLFAAALLVGALLPLSRAAAVDPGWRTLAPGLELGTFRGEWRTPSAREPILVLRIDPRQWELCALSIDATADSIGMTAREWCLSQGLVAATNAGMFDTDHRTHIGYFKMDGRVINPRGNGYLSAAVFSPEPAGGAADNAATGPAGNAAGDPARPLFRIHDLDAEPLSAISDRYRNVIQNLRLVKRPGENRWARQERMWSEAALGEDGSGRALFIFSRAAFSMHDLVEILLELPIDLVAAQHLEGGPEAQLFVGIGDLSEEWVGSYESGFLPGDTNDRAWRIPNAIGVRARSSD